ncbi:MAG: hypothetical protein ACI9MB_003774, partial [Verrucomicrobiales bacterium]
MFRPMNESFSLPRTIETPPKGKLRPLLVWSTVVIAVLAYFNLDQFPDFLLWPVRILSIAAGGYLVYATFRTIQRAKLTPKKLAFSLILVTLLYGVLFLICHIFVKLMSARDERIAATQSST